MAGCARNPWKTRADTARRGEATISAFETPAAERSYSLRQALKMHSTIRRLGRTIFEKRTSAHWVCFILLAPVGAASAQEAGRLEHKATHAAKASRSAAIRGALRARRAAGAAELRRGVLPLRVIRTRATWYGPGFHGRRTASGERFNQNAMTLAHRHLPFGTRVRVLNPKTGKHVIARVNDRGPFGKRAYTADLSKGVAQKIGFSGSGPVHLEVLPPPRR